MKSSRRVALVTGGSRGIGLSISNHLVRDGYIVYSCSRRRTAMTRCDGRIVEMECDIACRDQVDEMVSTIIRTSGRVDVLVNNAGVATIDNGRRRAVECLSREDWDRVISVNLTGAFNCVKATVPSMIECRSGKIINITSASVNTGGVLAAVDYIASKGGLLGLTRGLAFELGKYNIHVNAVAPGRIETDMNNNAWDALTIASELIPLRRTGTTGDVANVVGFLASDGADYITGATIHCNGGWVMD